MKVLLAAEVDEFPPLAAPSQFKVLAADHTTTTRLSRATDPDGLRESKGLGAAGNRDVISFNMSPPGSAPATVSRRRPTASEQSMPRRRSAAGAVRIPAPFIPPALDDGR
jgi:hypothetical protein